VYVVSPQLQGELGLALIDSGSMVSLVKISSIIRFKAQQRNIKLHGVTGKQINVMGMINIKIENSLDSWQKCYVVDSLPQDLDIILGQDWLEEAGYSIQKTAPVMIPPYSEKIIRCKTNKRGSRFVEHQILQPGLKAAASLVNCEPNEFPCLIALDQYLKSKQKYIDNLKNLVTEYLATETQNPSRRQKRGVLNFIG
jgi:hypothetical protein